MNLFFLIFALILSSTSLAIKVPICKGINLTGTYYISKNWKFSETIYQYSYNLNVTANFNNVTLPNTVTVYNFNVQKQQSNSFNFNRTSIFRFWFGTYGAIIDCNFSNESSCIFAAPNSKIGHHFIFKFNNKFKINKNEENLIFVNEGTIFHALYGQFFEPSKCQQSDIAILSIDSGYNYLQLRTQICCTIYDYIDIPNSIEDSCKKFKTKAKIEDSSNNRTIEFNVEYGFFKQTNNGDKYLNMSFEMENSTDPLYRNYLKIHDLGYIVGGGRSRFSNSVEPVKEYKMAEEFQYEMLFSYYDYVINKSNYTIIQTEYKQVIVGELIKRNGIFLRNNNSPFTKADPCWTKKAGIFQTNATYEASFCCIQFEDDINPIASVQKSIKTTTSIFTKKSQTSTSTTRTNFLFTSTPNIQNYSHQTINSDKTWLEIIFIFLREESAWFFSHLLRE